MNNMYALFIFMILSLIISMAMINISFMLTEKKSYLNKLSMYECGFTPFHKPNNPFSISFFLVGMLFLMFDLEIVLLFPWSMSTSKLNIQAQMTIFMFIILLMMGLWYEWMKGGLDWE